MAKRHRTARQQQLENALALLKAEQAALRQQRQRVAAARQVVARLSCCDWCGAQTTATGLEPQLCFDCSRDRAAIARRELLAQFGYGPDGTKLPRAAAA